MSFGRKGLPAGSLAGPPSGSSGGVVAAPARPPRTHIDSAGRRAHLAKIASFGLGILVVLLTIDVLFAGSTLITPLPEGLTYYATATGAALGFVWGVYFWLFGPQISRDIRFTLGLILGAPILAGAWANMVTWQLARDFEFTLSGARWEQAEYQVTGYGRPSRRSFGFSNYTVRIDPYDIGGDTDIPIPRNQYERYAFDSAGAQCVTVQQRKSASGAVEVLTDGQFNLMSPQPADIHRCSA